MTQKRLTALGIIAALAAVLLDQLSKWVMLEIVQITTADEIVVLPFFNLVMVWNRGISFGMFSEHDQPYLLVALAAVIVFILTRWLMKAESSWVALSLGLTIGGAVGNVIDRLRFGAVADFFDFHIDSYHWPAFNVADASIFIGVVLLCIHSMFMEPRK